jgi:hypothetical protein
VLAPLRYAPNPPLFRLFAFPSFMETVRLHNIMLMRKETNVNQVCHCIDLAENMLALECEGITNHAFSL